MSSWLCSQETEGTLTKLRETLNISAEVHKVRALCGAAERYSSRLGPRLVVWNMMRHRCPLQLLNVTHRTMFSSFCLVPRLILSIEMYSQEFRAQVTSDPEVQSLKRGYLFTGHSGIAQAGAPYAASNAQGRGQRSSQNAGTGQLTNRHSVNR